jgi:kynureninase
MDIPRSRDEVLALDAADPLKEVRSRFAISESVVYLDGNSLGPPPREVMPRIEEVLRSEWGGDLVRSWTTRGWIDLPEKVAGSIARLIGAEPGEVVVADSTSINIFKLISAALHLNSERQVILTERENFGTDLYVAQGVADLLGERATLKIVERSQLDAALNEDVAVLMLTHVDFRTGEMHDMSVWTSAAHEAGALVLWDLAHSAGAVPVDLEACAADLAVGCGYKYLNGGPGAPAFAYVASRYHGALHSPLWGWMGHEAPFDFEAEYRPAPGIGRLRVGTPPVLSLAALEIGARDIAEIGIDILRSKSVALSELFIGLVEKEIRGLGFDLVSPRESRCRGSQVSLRHQQAYAIVQALVAEGVIGDFRAPDLLRFGFAPAYVRFLDVWDAVAALKRIMMNESWKRPEYHEWKKVT